MAKDRDFDLQVRDAGAGAEMTLRGVISERVVLDANRAPAGLPLVIDAGGIANINSLGVRNWIRFIETLDERCASVTLRRLAPVLVLQASMISTFLGRARVESFLVPWYCPGCEQTADVEYALRDEVPEAIACSSCGGAMELDSDRETYLTFRNLVQS